MQASDIELDSADFQRDPLQTFIKLREEGSLVRTKLPLMGECWVTTTYEAADTVLRDSGSFVNDPSNAGRASHSGLWQRALGQIKSKNMSGRDGSDHRRIRKLVELAFSRSSIEAMRPHIASLVDRQLDHLERSSTGQHGKADLVSGFARQLPLAVICALLGLPEEDLRRVWIDFSKLKGRLSMIRLYWGSWRQTRYLRRYFELCRKEPRPGVISSLVAAELEGDKLTERELVAVALQLFGAGYETSVHLLTGGVLTLLRHPQQLSELQADWSRVGPAVDEILRYWSAVQMTTRYAAREMELYGRRIHRGDFIVVLVGAAGSDPEQFPEPERFDIHRKPNRHLAFGAGSHVCVGMKLAKVEAEIAFERLFTRFPQIQTDLRDDQLAWVQNVAMHGVRSLPVKLNPA